MNEIMLIEPIESYVDDIWRFRQEVIDSDDNKIIGVIDLRHHINHPILGT